MWARRTHGAIDTFAMPEEVIPLEVLNETEIIVMAAIDVITSYYATMVEYAQQGSCDSMGKFKELYFAMAELNIKYILPYKLSQTNKISLSEEEMNEIRQNTIPKIREFEADVITVWNRDYSRYECFISSEQQEAEISLRRQLKILQRIVTLNSFKELQTTVNELNERLKIIFHAASSTIEIPSGLKKPNLKESLESLLKEGFVSSSAEVLRDSNGQPLASLDANVDMMSGPMLIQYTRAYFEWILNTIYKPIFESYKLRTIVLQLVESPRYFVMDWKPTGGLMPAPAPDPATVSSIPSGCVNIPWKYDKGSNIITGPYTGCTMEDASQPWCMKPAYISGGTQNVHWKYTSDPNDPSCLTNWTYYDGDGNILASNISRTTTQGDTQPWCALPVYKRGGTQDKAWQSCSSATA